MTKVIKKVLSVLTALAVIAVVFAVLSTSLLQRDTRKIILYSKMRRAMPHLFQQLSIRSMTAHIPLF